MNTEYIRYKKIIHLEKEKRLELMQDSYLKNAMTFEHDYLILEYQRLLRLDEYYTNHASGLGNLLKFWYRRRKNVCGTKLGFTIPANVFDEGLLIWHYGNIVVNGFAKVGKNCTLHGDICIGNDGVSPDSPVIGDNVDIGTGARIIGNVHIADNVKIGAGAVVVHSINLPGAVVVGVPAKVVKVVK